MDLSKLTPVRDLNNYEQLTGLLQSKPDYRNILINENNVNFLLSTASWEFKYYKKHGCNGAAVTILYGMLRMPASKNWSFLGSKFIQILEKWIKFVIDILECNDNEWWTFLKTVMDILETISIKDSLIKLLIVEKITKYLLSLVINDKVVINRKILILKCLGKCSYQCGQKIKQHMTVTLKPYFVKLAKYMSTCGHMDMQLKLFETIMSWLLFRNDVKGRSEVASLLFTENDYAKNTIDMFIWSEFHNFSKDAAEWLNRHNSMTGNVVTFIYKKMIVGNTLLIGQPSRLHLNIGAKCLTVPLVQKLLSNCNLPYSEILTLNESNVQTVEFITGHQLTINVSTIEGPEFLYESTADVIVNENRLIEIQISNRTDVVRAQWALQNIFKEKYKRVNVVSGDRLSPTPSGSCYNDFHSHSMDLENLNVTQRPCGIKTVPVKGRKNSSPEAQERDKTPTKEQEICLPDLNDGDDYDLVDDVMMHVSPSVKTKNVTNTSHEQNSCLFDASIHTDHSLEECDIDENLVNNIIIDALNINDTEATARPDVQTSPKVQEPQELVVSKSTSVDEASSEAISDTPAGFINIRRKRISVVKNYTAFKKRRIEQNDFDVINNTPEENGGVLVRGVSYTFPKRTKQAPKENDKEARKNTANKTKKDESIVTSKKRKLYSSKDEAGLLNETEIEEAKSSTPVLNDAFDRLREMPTYPSIPARNREDDVTSNHSMKLRPRGARVFNFSSDDEDDFDYNNTFANRIRQKSPGSSLKSVKVKKTAIKPKTTVRKPRTKKASKQNTTKLDYTLVDETVRKSHREVLDTSITDVPTYNDELIHPVPKPNHIYPEVAIVNPEADLNNSSASLTSLNIEIEKPNVNDCSSDNFVTNVKKILNTNTTNPTNIITTNIVLSPLHIMVDRCDAEVHNDHDEQTDIESSPNKPNQSNKQKSVTHISPIATKSHDDIVLLDQIQYTEANTSSQDFQIQTKRVKRQSQKSKKRKTEPKNVAKSQNKSNEKDGTGLKPVQKLNTKDSNSNEDFQMRKINTRLKSAEQERAHKKTGIKCKKTCKDVKTVQECEKDLSETRSSQDFQTRKNNTNLKSAQKKISQHTNTVQKSNKTKAKGQKNVQNKDDTLIQEYNISLNSSSFSEEFNKRLPIVKLKKLRNVDIDPKTGKSKISSDIEVTLTQSSEHNQSVRKSPRIEALSRQSQENSSFDLIENANLSWNAFYDPDVRTGNTNSQRPSVSRNTSTPNISPSQKIHNRTRSNQSTQEPSRSIAKDNENISSQSLYVKSSCIRPFTYDATNLPNCIDQSHEDMPINAVEISNVSEASVESRSEEMFEIIIKALEVVKTENEKCHAEELKCIEVFLEDWVDECKRRKEVLIENLKVAQRNFTEKNNNVFNELQQIIKSYDK